MNTLRTNNTIRYFLGAGLALAFAAAVVPVAAEEDAEGTPEEQEKDCGTAVKTCDVDGVMTAYTAMRLGCKDYRECRTGCGDERKSCKESARVAKRDCNDACKSKSGKEKRECKSACTTEKKEAKAACRAAKRGCAKTCRKEFKSKECVQARGDFWGSFVGKGRNCAVDVTENCESPFPQKD